MALFMTEEPSPQKVITTTLSTRTQTISASLWKKLRP